MEQIAPPPHAARRAWGAVLAVLAIVGTAGAAFLVRKPLLMVVPLCADGQWDRCFGTFNGVALWSVATLPVALLVLWSFARRRSAAGDHSAWRRSLAEVGMVYGTLPWLWITMLPGSGAGVVTGRVSLVPLRDLATMDTGQVVGNLLVLAALGSLAPVRFAAMRSLPRILALGAGCSIMIEVAQYVLRLDRVSSVDDVLLNTVGAVIAALISRPWWRTPSGVLLDRSRPLPAGVR